MECRQRRFTPGELRVIEIFTRYPSSKLTAKGVQHFASAGKLLTNAAVYQALFRLTERGFLRKIGTPSGANIYEINKGKKARFVISRDALSAREILNTQLDCRIEDIARTYGAEVEDYEISIFIK